MSTATAARLALRAIRRAKVRTALTGLVLAVGVLAVTLTLATGEGARAAVRHSFKAMFGSLDVLYIQPGGPAERGMATQASAVTTLTPADGDALAGGIPGIASVAQAQLATNITFDAAGHTAAAMLWGVTASWRAVRGDSIASGRFLSAQDDSDAARVVILGATLARALFPDINPIGRPVRVAGVDCTVIGLLSPAGAGPGGIALDNMAYMPIRTTARRVLDRQSLGMLGVALARPDNAAAVEASVRRVLRDRHGLTDGRPDDFRISVPRAMLARVEATDSTLRVVLLRIAVLALLVGGIVVANVMYAATTRRQREIATRRAVGATRGDIRLQVWMETIAVALMAGLAGGIVGVAMTAVGGWLMGAPLAVPWLATLGVVGVTALIGVGAGYLPARHAASLAPADALREGA